MLGDHNHAFMIGEARPPSNGLRPEPAGIGFDLDGVPHRLVRRSAWPGACPAGAPSHGSPDRVVGQMVFAGEQHLILRPPEAHEPVGPPAVPLNQLLTHREMEIAILMAEGLCDKQIARALGISGHTVREHTRRAMAKLKVSRRTAIVSHVLGVLAGQVCADL